VSWDFLLLVFSWISFPPAPEYSIKTISIFFENSRRYLQFKVHHQYEPVANLPPVSTTPAKKLPTVSTTPAANFSTSSAISVAYTAPVANNGSNYQTAANNLK
jgi:hypothetical protein